MSSINSNAVIWKSEYNIGNFKIDKEHQELFIIAKRAVNILDKKEKEALDQLKDIIKSLFQYVSSHFKHEEEHMKNIRYPNLQRHKELHKKMIAMLSSLIEELNSLELKEIQNRILAFINEYFVNHIISEDKRIQLYEISLEDLRESFGWKDIYQVNNSIIDSEHKQLFDIASSAFEVVEDEKRNKKIKSIIIDLYDYMKRHFSHEEKYMKEINYIEIEEHKKLHKNIIDTLNQFVKELPTLDTVTFEKELARIIDITLVQHIIQEDRKIMAWERANKK